MPHSWRDEDGEGGFDVERLTIHLDADDDAPAFFGSRQINFGAVVHVRLGVRVSDTSARIQARDTEIDAGEHPGREPKRCGLGVAGYRNLLRKVRDDQALEIRGDVVRHAAFYSGNHCCRSGPMGSPDGRLRRKEAYIPKYVMSNFDIYRI